MIQKKLLLVSVTVGVLTPFQWGQNIAHAEEVTVLPENPSDNEVEVNEKDYAINGKKTELGDDDIYEDVYGSYVEYGYMDVTGNTVNINGGIFSKVSGGRAYSGNVTDNNVTINGGIFYGETLNGDIWSSSVLGGYSAYGNVTNNTLTINGGTFSGSVYGGNCGHYFSSNGSTTNNTLTINGGTFSDSVYGGHSEGDNNVTNNTLTINGGTFSRGVMGGYSEGAGNVTGNTVNIYNSPDMSSAYIGGGDYYGIGGTSSGNTLNFYTKSITAVNIGDFQNINFYLDSNISNGDTMLTLTDSDGTDISGATVNAVMQVGSTLNNGDLVTLLKNTNGVTEAQSYSGTLAEGVSLAYPMTVRRANDGQRIILGIGDFVDDSETSGVDDNPGIEDNTSSDDNTGDDTSIVDDSNNTVNITAETRGTIYGGNTSTGSAANNIVNLYGGTDLQKIYGGYAPSGETSGNVLNVYNKNISAQNIYNFDNLNFYIPNEVSSGDTLLTLTSSEGTDLSNMTIRAGVVAGNNNLAVGDTINLLTNPNGLTTSGTTYGNLTEGVSLDYGLNLSQSGNSIVASVQSVPTTLRKETQILAETNISGLNIIDTALSTPTFAESPTVDFESGVVSEVETGSTSEVETESSSETESENETGTNSDAQNVEHKGYEIFANMGGGSLRTKGIDGSYVDMTSRSINLGFARSFQQSAGRFSIAPIIDYASGNYDSYLETGIHGSGSTKYIAGGLIARRMLQNGFYYETSFRAGKVKTDFSSDNLDSSGAFGRITYNASATALSGHLKLGKVFRLNKNNLLDVYTIYNHAHQNGMGADLSSGEHYNFSSADSGRFRIGYRLTTRTSRISQIYTGLAYQYENASGITATYKNYETPSAGDNGSSGMLELGWIIKPLKKSPFAVDINVTGWQVINAVLLPLLKSKKLFDKI